MRHIGAGIAAALTYLGVAELVSRGAPVASALLSDVAEVLIPFIPTFVSEPIIRLFGTSDKALLIVVLVLGGMIIGGICGFLSSRNRRRGITWFSVAGALVLALAVLNPTSTLPENAISALGLACGIGAFVWLTSLADRAVPIAVAGEDESSSAGLDPRADHRALSEAEAARRAFLVGSVLLAGVGAAAVVFGRSLASVGQRAAETISDFVLPPVAKAAATIPADAEVGVPGVDPFLTPADEFYRIDTVLTVPQVAPEDWSLRIHGRVDTEVTLSFQDVLELDLEEHHVTLTCVSNPVGGPLIGSATWTGYPIRKLLEKAGVQADADMVLSHSIDGFSASTPLEYMTDDRASLLAIGQNGEPLLPEHGYPARLVVPGLYGYVSATKWVTELEVTRFDEAEAYWTKRGWDEKGPVLVASRIDVPRSGADLEAGNAVVAGVAWAQHMGVAKVEVRVDLGEWMTADLGAEVGVDTWRQWRIELPSLPTTSHVVEVRATDKDGVVQSGVQKGPLPNAATGYHQVDFRTV